MSMNRVVLVGRLVRDPDLRYTPNGIAVANFTIACNRPFKTKDGEQEADFINGVIWRKAAESLAEYMKKGSMIGVDGRLQSRTYDDKDGKKVFVTEVLAESIQFLESKSSQQSGGGQANNQSQQPSPYDYQQTSNQSNTSSNPFSGAGEPIDISGDDLPF